MAQPLGAALAANTGAAGAMQRVGFFAAKAAPPGLDVVSATGMEQFVCLMRQAVLTDLNECAVLALARQLQ
ncbi:hypothetical protein D0O09_19465 [Pseudomonas putida]|nr:hypothetical protein D0O09_19465 [Pseudomonas putida]